MFRCFEASVFFDGSTLACFFFVSRFWLKSERDCLFWFLFGCCTKQPNSDNARSVRTGLRVPFIFHAVYVCRAPLLED